MRSPGFFIGILIGIVLAGAGLAAQTESKPDIVLTGQITRSDYHTYREVPFTVPAGVTRLTIEFSYTGREQHTVIDLGLFDSERFRGWSGGNKSTFTLSVSDATPSYLSGPIHPGVWKLILGVPNIRKGVRSAYTAKIFFAHGGAVAPVSPFIDKPIRAEVGWYRGDLHMHTGHSDASCRSESGRKVPCPVFKTLEAAVHRGLDFVAISDHNTTSQYEAMRELQPYFDRLLLIAGREITTDEGHAGVLGTTQFIDFRLMSPHVPNLNALLDEVQKLHAIISINHPVLPSGEKCMGCGWTVPDTDFSRIQAIEAVNGGNAEGPYSGIPFWQRELNRGFRLTGIGGSDNHDADLADATSSIGHPATVIYAQNLSQHAILDGIRSGRVFIDVDGTQNRLLNFWARIGAKTVHMGQESKAPRGERIEFFIRTAGVVGSHVDVVEDAHKTDLMSRSTIRQNKDVQTFSFTSDGQRHWLRVNVRSPQGRLLLVGNPIYLNF